MLYHFVCRNSDYIVCFCSGLYSSEEWNMQVHPTTASGHAFTDGQYLLAEDVTGIVSMKSIHKTKSIHVVIIVVEGT